MAPPQSEQFRPKITVFHCLNTLAEPALECKDGYEVKAVNMPCSSMIREVFLLKAFEAGSDAVLVLVCPEGHCRNVNGNVRSAKRVARVKKMVDEIGLDGRRLNVCSVPPGNQQAIARILEQTAQEARDLGPNPAS